MDKWKGFVGREYDPRLSPVLDECGDAYDLKDLSKDEINQIKEMVPEFSFDEFGLDENLLINLIILGGEPFLSRFGAEYNEYAMVKIVQLASLLQLKKKLLDRYNRIPNFDKLIQQAMPKS